MKGHTTLVRYIEHTLLRPDATRQDIRQLCIEAKTHGFCGVCVNSFWIPYAVEQLDGAAVLPIATVGFPLGAMSTRAKAFEARLAAGEGALEIDMVANLGLLKGKDYRAYERDIRRVVEAAGAHRLKVKVILETAELERDEIIASAKAAQAGGAHFVKTSTGFSKRGGATVEAVKLLRDTVGGSMGVKASGGIRNAGDAWALIAAGADRIGASSSVAMVAAESIPLE